jgi:hypothetical protein
MALLIVLALIVALFIGLGFVVKWLFIIAIIAALIWLIAFFTRGGRARDAPQSPERPKPEESGSTADPGSGRCGSASR